MPQIIRAPPPLGAPFRHSRDARVYGHTTTAMHKLSTPPTPPPFGEKGGGEKDESPPGCSNSYQQPLASFRKTRANFHPNWRRRTPDASLQIMGSTRVRVSLLHSPFFLRPKKRYRYCTIHALVCAANTAHEIAFSPTLTDAKLWY